MAAESESESESVSRPNPINDSSAPASKKPRCEYSLSEAQEMQYLKNDQLYLIPGFYSYYCLRIVRGDPSIKTEYHHFIEFEDDYFTVGDNKEPRKVDAPENVKFLQCLKDNVVPDEFEGDGLHVIQIVRRDMHIPDSVEHKEVQACEDSDPDNDTGGSDEEVGPFESDDNEEGDREWERKIKMYG